MTASCVPSSRTRQRGTQRTIEILGDMDSPFRRGNPHGEIPRPKYTPVPLLATSQNRQIDPGQPPGQAKPGVIALAGGIIPGKGDAVRFRLTFQGCRTLTAWRVLVPRTSRDRATGFNGGPAC
jgi:hypothetical protein